jgi:hypothetical protein
MTGPRLHVARPADVPDLTGQPWHCVGGNPCTLCVKRVVDVAHTLHRCNDPACLCHDAWRLRAADWDALVRCGRCQMGPTMNAAGVPQEPKT